MVDDARFNIANHVVESNVTPPGGEVELLQACADTWPELLDRSRPVWELRLFSGMSGNRLGVTFKLHHALADGTAIVAMMQALFDFEAEAVDPEAGQWTPEPAPEAKALVADNLSTRLHGTVEGIRRLPHIRGVISGFATFVSDIRMTLRFGSEAPKPHSTER